MEPRHGQGLIDQERLWSDLMTLGAIGGTPAGGSMRGALSPADREGRALFSHWAIEAGLSLRADRIGNLFARREGRDPQAAPVMIGSHLDTQLPGGRFDGVLGVLAGLAVCRALDRAGIVTRRPIEVVDWTNEEGARFQPGVMGSAVYTGALDLDEALARQDPQGISVAQALHQTGTAGTAPVPGRIPHSYLELHIEQGPELDTRGKTIGMVTTSSAMCSGYATIRGANGHTQTLAMSRRRNALAGAARLVLAIEEIGAGLEPAGMVSASVLENWPNNRVNIPHLSTLSWAVVGFDPALRNAAVARIEAAAADIARETGLEIEIDHRHYREPCHFDDALIARGMARAAARGLPAMTLPTLTAHDALSFTALCPTALIFVPCKDGVSHSEAEWCRPEDAARGAEILLDLACEAADAP
ncbi:Zn-dependent hydrolase (plasmid) [Thioclava litoralis]|uniref:Zn-dependent hydrolase n=1 Tax=Thioclava litoralis TaxID=3076557 RepID=A0ABZ1E2J9_9RHOB|nr:Zn-dependent hydrolase [Thioclava sp. FTW29]